MRVSVFIARVRTEKTGYESEEDSEAVGEEEIVRVVGVDCYVTLRRD